MLGGSFFFYWEFGGGSLGDRSTGGLKRDVFFVVYFLDGSVLAGVCLVGCFVFCVERSFVF